MAWSPYLLFVLCTFRILKTFAINVVLTLKNHMSLYFEYIIKNNNPHCGFPSLDFWWKLDCEFVIVLSHVEDKSTEQLIVKPFEVALLRGCFIHVNVANSGISFDISLKINKIPMQTSLYIKKSSIRLVLLSLSDFDNSHSG